MTTALTTPPRFANRGVWLVVALICAFGLKLAGTGLGHESAVSLDGDMPRYLMNGVFLHDLAIDFPIAAPLEYANRYYARYPSLSLGHHPILPAIVLAPFYFLFGISVFSARLSVLLALVVTLVLWFRLIRSIYDTPTATLASLLLLTTPGFPALFRVVLSEPYAICLMMCSLYAMHGYCRTERKAYAVAFVASAIGAVYAKQLIVAVFPVFAFQLMSAFGWRRLFAGSSLIMASVIVLAVLPIVPLTLKYSQFNVLIVTKFVDMSDRTLQDNFTKFPRRLLAGAFAVGPAVLGLGALALIGAAIQRDRRVLLFVVWIVSVYIFVTALGVGQDRFSCYWLPAFAALGAASSKAARGAMSRALLLTLVTGIVLFRGWTMGDPAARERGPIRLAGAGGYEEAAEFVASQRHGDVVLYSAAVDTGYFTFFLRKHNPARDLVLLRADKVLTTSLMNKLDFKKQIQSPDEVLPLIRKYGVGYVVIENGIYPPGALQWLEDIATSDVFEPVRQISIGTSDRRLHDGSISIYRYRGEPVVDPEARLTMTVRAMGADIGVRLQDLLRPRNAIP
jgi:hypothetical protein